MKTRAATPVLPMLVPASAAEYLPLISLSITNQSGNKQISGHDRNRSSNLASMQSWYALLSFSFPIIDNGGQEQQC